MAMIALHVCTKPLGPCRLPWCHEAQRRLLTATRSVCEIAQASLHEQHMQAERQEASVRGA